jgi:hypothetical protein
VLEAFVGMVNLRSGGGRMGQRKIVGWEGWEE